MLSNAVKIIGLNKGFIQLFCRVVIATTLCNLFLLAIINIFVPHQPKSTQTKPFSDSSDPSKVWSVHPDTPNKVWPGHRDTSSPSKVWPGHRDTSSPSKVWPGNRDTSSPSKVWPGHRDTLSKVWPGHRDTLSKVGPDHRDTLLKNGSTVYYPWANDTQCNIFAVRLAKNNTFQPRALVSFPGSGNSWLRHLIDCSTGIFTGSVYADSYASKNYLLGELRPPNEGSTIVQKTHHELHTTHTGSLFSCKISQRRKFAKLSEELFGYRGILLIRNPYDAILSFWNFARTRSHSRYGRKFNSSHSKWINHIERSAELWYNLIMIWVVNSKDLLIVLYEDLKMNPRKELLRIHKYLKQPVNTKRLDCLLKKEHLAGRFHRPHRISKSQQLFPRNSTQSIQIQDPSARKSIFANNNHYPPLDLIIQVNIHKINHLFLQKNISIQLNYTNSL